ncbi:MAG: hypothetical protein JWM44_836, partial [Bacilli bacterium]|nr:hypothetical protein [Bacilli bacterium]
NKGLAEYYYEKCKSLETIFGSTELLHYALITNDRQKFILVADQLSEQQLKDNDISKFLLLAAMVWKDSSYLKITSISEDEPLYQLFHAILALLEENRFVSLVEADASSILQMAIELFNLQYFDTFDWFINLYYTPSLINQIANYFHSLHKFALAIDYYSLLLNENQLYSIGYENLANLYIVQGEVEEGLNFLENAIKLSPHQINLYLYLCSHCNDPIKKEDYKTQFLDRFPQYSGLSFITKI